MRTESAISTRAADAAATAQPGGEPRPPPRVLLVEDEPDAQEALARIIEAEGFVVDVAATLACARTSILTGSPGLVVTDLRLPDGMGIDLVRELRDSPEVEVVVVTGHASIETAIDALRLGAFDYVTKPVDVAHLKRVLAHIRRTLRLRGEIGVLRGELRSLGRFGRLIGSSPAMQKVYDALGRVGPTEASVLLSGESGTGKELAAMTLHDLSRRRDKPFVAINCGAMSPSIIESELFGHERGSFTGAVQKHSGVFERSNGGTLFLDEIAEMPPELQVRLLRVLESGRLLRVGGEKEIAVDVRVIAATNRNPEAAVAERRLREDLFYRLSVVRIGLPPLRERGGDIRILAEHFLRGIGSSTDAPKTLAAAAIACLASHRWPGNVRELKNVVQSAFIMADDEIGPEHLPFASPPPPGADEPAVRPDAAPAAPAIRDAPAPPDIRIPVGTTAADAERRLIFSTLEHCGGKKREAARILALSLKTLYARLRTYSKSSDAEPGAAAAP